MGKTEVLKDQEVLPNSLSWAKGKARFSPRPRVPSGEQTEGAVVQPPGTLVAPFPFTCYQMAFPRMTEPVHQKYLGNIEETVIF